MKRTLFISALLAIVVLGAAASANPPNKIGLSYDSSRKELNILIEHPSSDRKEHFIREVVVYKNGGEVFKQTYDFQTSLRNQTIPPVAVDAVQGDILRVTATCNKFGTGENSIKVE